MLGVPLGVPLISCNETLSSTKNGGIPLIFQVYNSNLCGAHWKHLSMIRVFSVYMNN